MGLEEAFAACLPKKRPAFALDARSGLPTKPTAIPEPMAAPSSPKPRRSSKTALAVGLPAAPSRGVPLAVKFGLALAALALVWRRLFVIYSRTTDAIFVFVAIELLVWLRFRSGSLRSGRGGAAGAKPTKRERGMSTALAQEGEARVIQMIRAKLRNDSPPGLTDNDELLDVQLLRFVREVGLNEAKVEKRFRSMLEWKEKTFTDEALRLQVNPDEDMGAWLSSEEMPKGEWASRVKRVRVRVSLSLSLRRRLRLRVRVRDARGRVGQRGQSRRLAAAELDTCGPRRALTSARRPSGLRSSAWA